MLHLPPYNKVAHLEGKGNWAVRKYYKFPYSLVYRHKLKMITRYLKGEWHKNILDFGTGAGIFLPELKKYARFVRGVQGLDEVHPKWKYDRVVCASVLEFVSLNYTLKRLHQVMKFNSRLLIASPMTTTLTTKYFNLIDSKDRRHHHKEILRQVSNRFHIDDYTEWCGLYFSVEARPK